MGARHHRTDAQLLAGDAECFGHFYARHEDVVPAFRGPNVRPRSRRPRPKTAYGVATGPVAPALRVADASGDLLAWGLRTFRTTRGYACVQLGRMQGDRLGIVGRDGAFGDDGCFHALGPQVLDRGDCVPRDARGRAVLHVAFRARVAAMGARAAYNVQVFPHGGGGCQADITGHPLERDVAAGQHVGAAITLDGPSCAGGYRIELDYRIASRPPIWGEGLHYPGTPVGSASAQGG
jgi:hypothetical protein